MAPGYLAGWFLLVGFSPWEAMTPSQGQEERKVRHLLLLLSSCCVEFLGVTTATALAIFSCQPIVLSGLEMGHNGFSLLLVFGCINISPLVP